MFLIDNNNETIILDSIHTPTKTDHFWVLDLNILDYTLTPLLILEEIVSPSIEVQISNFRFILPTTWNILVTDEETSQLDVVSVAELPGREFKALVYGPLMSRAKIEPVRVTNYFPNYKNVGPHLNKHQMLCHPISSSSWINVAPSDIFNKHLKNCNVGDII